VALTSVEFVPVERDEFPRDRVARRLIAAH